MCNMTVGLPSGDTNGKTLTRIWLLGEVPCIFVVLFSVYVYIYKRVSDCIYIYMYSVIGQTSFIRTAWYPLI